MFSPGSVLANLLLSFRKKKGPEDRALGRQAVSGSTRTSGPAAPARGVHQSAPNFMLMPVSSVMSFFFWPAAGLLL